MGPQIALSREILEKFREDESQGLIPMVDRSQVVAHATLSALAHHWPSRTDAGIQRLLESTARIKALEHSRWAAQRRIAIAKLARFYND
jgi:transposase